MSNPNAIYKPKVPEGAEFRYDLSLRNFIALPIAEELGLEPDKFDENTLTVLNDGQNKWLTGGLHIPGETHQHNLPLELLEKARRFAAAHPVRGFISVGRGLGPSYYTINGSFIRPCSHLLSADDRRYVEELIAKRAA